MRRQIEGAHTLGATAVSWAPAEPKGSLVSGKPPGQPVKRFVSGGCDNAVKVSMAVCALTLIGCSESAHILSQCALHGVKAAVAAQRCRGHLGICQPLRARDLPV